MKHINWILSGMILLASVCACKKDKEPVQEKKSARELLTQKEWGLVTAGFDDNNNGKIDPLEEMVDSCTKDNSYIFKTDGTGIFSDNAISCGGEPHGTFTWQLLHGDSTLKLEFQEWKLRKLDEKEMVLAEEVLFTTDLLLVYKAL